MKFKSIFILFFLIAVLSSCTSYKKIGYLKDVDSLTPEQLEKIKDMGVIKVKPGDPLTITVNSTNPSAAIPFNMPFMPTPTEGSSTLTNTVGSQSYVVDREGNINFPVLGKLHVAGLTKIDVENLIKNKIYPQYIKEEPIIMMRPIYFTVNAIGEFNRPGISGFSKERVDLLDAIATSGDLTIYGRRDNVLIKRTDADGTVHFGRLNLQDKDIILSPYFYMQQNDVIYVEPNKAKGNSASIGSTESMTISIIGTLLSVATLLITVLK